MTTTQLTRKELIPTQIIEQPAALAKEAARIIADLIRTKASEGKPCVLGLSTGSSPISIYKELVRLHQEEGLSFQNVITFNLDEYYPMHPIDLQSYVRFMHEHLFDHVDIPKEQVHIPDGEIAESEINEFCKAYEEKIKSFGGIDLQLLGIGRTGHIGFNEPGSEVETETRLIYLDHVTRLDAASDFFGEENVPRKAITMGIKTIMQAKQIILIALGEGKSPIIKRTVEGPVSSQVPATFLQDHPNTLFLIDMAAASQLTRIVCPWTLIDLTWDENLIKKAVIWLSKYLEKPILKLTDRDYAEHGMNQLMLNYGHAYSVNLQVFNQLQRTITGWPGGKPNVDDSNRPERAEPSKKRVIIFSPHPDDDVISMGGTFSRLVDQGHDVHVVYQTSGNIAVFDDDVIRYADFFESMYDGISHDFKKQSAEASLYVTVKDTIANKKKGDIDSAEVRLIKGLIRKSEAKAAARYIGLSDENIHFLDLPFYESGRIKKNPVTQADLDIMVNIIDEIKPHQIFLAGDLSDPHGTHRVCLSLAFQALNHLQHEAFMRDCWIWLYRGAWQEWDIHEIDMAVPLSPDELLRKRRAIFKHQSQKDSALFPGNDPREFWVRAEDRNRETARTYDLLGFPEYEAIESFKRYYLE